MPCNISKFRTKWEFSWNCPSTEMLHVENLLASWSLSNYIVPTGRAASFKACRFGQTPSNSLPCQVPWRFRRGRAGRSGIRPDSCELMRNTLQCNPTFEGYKPLLQRTALRATSWYRQTPRETYLNFPCASCRLHSFLPPFAPTTRNTCE
jgi:hypothetical protein